MPGAIKSIERLEFESKTKDQLLRPTVEVETVKFFVLAKCWWSRVKQVNCAVIITAATLFTL